MCRDNYVPHFGVITELIQTGLGTNTIVVQCSSSLGSLFSISPLTLTYTAAGGFYSIPTNIAFVWDSSNVSMAVVWQEPQGALVQRYDTTWSAYGVSVTRSYPGGTTVLPCEVRCAILLGRN